MFFNHEVAYKYKMSSMQAALGLAQLERIEELIAHKRRIFDWYARELRGVPGLTLNDEAQEVKNTYWMVTVILDPSYENDQDELLELLGQRGVDCRPFFRPLSGLPAYADSQAAREARERNQVSYRLSPFGVNLPCGMNMTEELVGQVCATLKDVLHART